MKKKKRSKNQIIIRLPDMNSHAITEVHYLLENILYNCETILAERMKYLLSLEGHPVGLQTKSSEREPPF